MTYGSAFTVSAQLSIKDKSPIVNLPVRVEGKSAGESTWRTLASAVTNSEGKIEKTIALGKSTSIRIYSDPSWERTEGVSAEFPITISRALNIKAPTNVKSATQFQISGHLIPRTADVAVSLEKLVGKQWSAIVEPVTTDAQGNFVFTLPAQSRGVLTLRTVVSADTTWSALTGQTFNIIIR